jgi:hypothetical protein
MGACQPVELLIHNGCFAVVVVFTRCHGDMRQAIKTAVPQHYLYQVYDTSGSL